DAWGVGGVVVVPPPPVAPPAVDGLSPSAASAAVPPPPPLVTFVFAPSAAWPSEDPRRPDSTVFAFTFAPAAALLASWLFCTAEPKFGSMRTALSKKRPASSNRPASSSSNPRLYDRNAASDRVGR